jgi:UDP-glucose/iron transport system permease protein
MLKELFANPLTLGCAQAVVATLLALAVMLLARRREIHLERETLTTLVRGIAQITAVGSILVLLLRGPSVE